MRCSSRMQDCSQPTTVNARSDQHLTRFAALSSEERDFYQRAGRFSGRRLRTSVAFEFVTTSGATARIDGLHPKTLAAYCTPLCGVRDMCRAPIRLDADSYFPYRGLRCRAHEHVGLYAITAKRAKTLAHRRKDEWRCEQDQITHARTLTNRTDVSLRTPLSAACAERSRSVCGKSIADACAARASPFSLEEKVGMRCSIERCARSLAVNSQPTTVNAHSAQHRVATNSILAADRGPALCFEFETTCGATARV
jgi:hypothetical protein